MKFTKCAELFKSILIVELVSTFLSKVFEYEWWSQLRELLPIIVFIKISDLHKGTLWIL